MPGLTDRCRQRRILCVGIRFLQVQIRAVWGYVSCTRGVGLRCEVFTTGVPMERHAAKAKRSTAHIKCTIAG